jgi:hypothetical protein
MATDRKTWQEFRDAGMLWWINRILHTFGWSIVVEAGDDGVALDAFPARTDWLGFPKATDERRLKQFREGQRYG